MAKKKDVTSSENRHRNEPREDLLKAATSPYISDYKEVDYKDAHKNAEPQSHGDADWRENGEC